MCTDAKWPHDGTVSHILYFFLYYYFLSHTGSGQKKTVYVDSPLLKTEVTVRERSHIYHQESLKLSFKRNGSRGVFHVMTELPANEHKSSVCKCLPHPTRKYILFSHSSDVF